VTIHTIDESQRKAATAVGITYLLADAILVFDEFYVRSRLIAYDNTAKTAANIMASERLFRLSIAGDLIGFATDVVLIVALYVILSTVNRNLALLAAFWRLIETFIEVVTTLSSFDVLRLLSGAAYLRAFEADRLQALTMLSIGAHDAGYEVGLFFFGLGSAVFSYLWLKSRYIPRALAAWGLIGSLLAAASPFAFSILPSFANIVEPWSYMPIGVFEIALALWLLVKGLRQPDHLSPIKQAGRTQA
jgi:hypothetical protein